MHHTQRIWGTPRLEAPSWKCSQNGDDLYSIFPQFIPRFLTLVLLSRGNASTKDLNSGRVSIHLHQVVLYSSLYRKKVSLFHFSNDDVRFSTAVEVGPVGVGDGSREDGVLPKTIGGDDGKLSLDVEEGGCEVSRRRARGVEEPNRV
jgi:hypothetical protein